MALATLSIDLEAKIAAFQEGLDKSGRLLQKHAAEMETRWSRVEASVKGVAAALGGIATVRGLGALFLDTVKAVDGFNDLADATGASIENISALENVARQNGGTLDDVAGVLVKFNAALKDASATNDAGRAFKALNLDIAEPKRLDPAEALRLTAVALAGYANDGNKARLVQELFGKSIREAAPFLKDLAEAGQLNSTVTTKQAEEAEKFNKQLAEMSTQAGNATRRILQEFVPALNEILKAYNDRGLLAALDQFGNSAFDWSGSQARKSLLVAMEDMDRLTKQRASLSGDAFGGSGKTGAIAQALLGISGEELDRQILQTEAKIEKLRKVLFPPTTPERFKDTRAVPLPTLPVPLPTLPGGKKEPTDDEKPKVTESQRALASYVAQLDAVIGKTRSLSQEQQALDFLKGLGAEGDNPQVRELVLGLAERVDLQKALNDDLDDERKLREQILRIEGEQLAAQKALDQQIDEFTGSLEQARKVALTARLEARLAAGEIFTPEQLEKAVKGIAGIKDEAAKVTDDMNKRWEQFASNVQDAFGDTITRTLSGDFDDIGKMWKNLLLRMAGEAIAADIGNRLFGDLLKGGQGSNGGGLFSLASSFLSLFGFAKGGAFGSGGQRLALADGGVLTGATPFAFSGGLGVAGEAGPEAVMPLQRGRGGKLGVVAQGGGGGVTVINNVAAGVQRGEVIAAIQLGMQQVEGRIMSNLRRARVL